MVEEQGYAQEQNGNMDVFSRIRTVEGKYNMLRDRVLIINQNMIAQYQKSSAEMKALEEDLQEVKHSLFQIKETLKHLVREMENFSRKDELRVLEKYINLWNPMNFVTAEEVERIIAEKTKKVNK